MGKESDRKRYESLNWPDLNNEERQEKYNFYKVEQVNGTTFRIRKKDKVEKTSADFYRSKHKNLGANKKNILKEASELRNIIENAGDPNTHRKSITKDKKYITID